MNKLLSKKIEQKIKASKEKRWGYLFFLIGLIAFISFIYAGRQYNLTIVKFEYVVAFHVFSGIVCSILTLKYKQNFEGKDFNIFRHFIWTTVIYGEIFCALLFMANNLFADKNEYELSCQIIERNITHKSSTNYAVISIQDFEKDIYFPNKEMAELTDANYVGLTLCDGLWGFPIIKNIKLTR